MSCNCKLFFPKPLPNPHFQRVHFWRCDFCCWIWLFRTLLQQNFSHLILVTAANGTSSYFRLGRHSISESWQVIVSDAVRLRSGMFYKIVPRLIFEGVWTIICLHPLPSTPSRKPKGRGQRGTRVRDLLSNWLEVTHLYSYKNYAKLDEENSTYFKNNTELRGTHETNW